MAMNDASAEARAALVRRQREESRCVAENAGRVAAASVVTEKRCVRCEESKPVAEFRRNARMRDGLHSWCKACSVERTREWRAEHRDELNARRRARYAEEKLFRREPGRARRSRHRAFQDVAEGTGSARVIRPVRESGSAAQTGDNPLSRGDRFTPNTRTGVDS